MHSTQNTSYRTELNMQNENFLQRHSHKHLTITSEQGSKGWIAPQYYKNSPKINLAPQKRTQMQLKFSMPTQKLPNNFKYIKNRSQKSQVGCINPNLTIQHNTSILIPPYNQEMGDTMPMRMHKGKMAEKEAKISAIQEKVQSQRKHLKKLTQQLEKQLSANEATPRKHFPEPSREAILPSFKNINRSRLRHKKNASDIRDSRWGNQLDSLMKDKKLSLFFMEQQLVQGGSDQNRRQFINRSDLRVKQRLN